MVLEGKLRRRDIQKKDVSKSIKDIELMMKEDPVTGVRQIEANLEVQRGEVWKEEKKQGLFISLLSNKPIPHLHCNKITNEDGIEILRVLDGKQRLSSIRDILDGKVSINLKEYEKLEPVEENRDPAILDYFSKGNTRTRLSFNDLSERNKNIIKMNTELTITQYINLSTAGEYEIFGTLNAGEKLSEVIKALNAINSQFRVELIQRLSSKFGDLFFTETEVSQSDDQAFVVRLYHMLDSKLNSEKECLITKRGSSVTKTFFTTLDEKRLTDLENVDLAKPFVEKKTPEIKEMALYMDSLIQDFNSKVSIETFIKYPKIYKHHIIYYFSTLFNEDRVLYEKFLEEFLPFSEDKKFYQEWNKSLDLTTGNQSKKCILLRQGYVDCMFQQFKKEYAKPKNLFSKIFDK